MAETLQITPNQFRRIRDLVQENFGINITPDRQAMVNTRLRTMLRERGLQQTADMVEQILSAQPADLTSALVDSLTTNHTYFNRGPQHFVTFRQVVLPTVTNAMPAHKRDLRVWCAAASTGEEPYNIAMHMLEHLGPQYGSWQAGLLATDLSSDVLEQAQRGVYPADAVEAAGAGLAQKYFDPMPDGSLRAKEQLRREVLFRRFNLMTDPFPFRGQFQIVFCRNVLIYFNDVDRAAVIDRIRKSLVPDGWVFIGMSETIPPDSGFKRVEPGLYRRIK